MNDGESKRRLFAGTNRSSRERSDLVNRFCRRCPLASSYTVSLTVLEKIPFIPRTVNIPYQSFTAMSRPTNTPAVGPRFSIKVPPGWLAIATAVRLSKFTCCGRILNFFTDIAQDVYARRRGRIQYHSTTVSRLRK